jgi:hypothetical protein
MAKMPLEQQIDRALAVLNAHTKPVRHIVVQRPPRPRGGKRRGTAPRCRTCGKATRPWAGLNWCPHCMAAVATKPRGGKPRSRTHDRKYSPALPAGWSTWESPHGTGYHAMAPDGHTLLGPYKHEKDAAAAARQRARRRGGKGRLPVTAPRHPSPWRAGDRVQMHPGTDAWMRGDRYGDVVGVLRSGVVMVKMDSGQTRRVHPRNLIEVD